jgi:CRISPR-associated endonuclease/helicase Cas3
MQFERDFKALTGFGPLSWQRRLFNEYLKAGKLPAAVDIPTGLGKTAVMALWLVARAHGALLPRRLVYVVDRRAVVDQATGFALDLRTKLDAPTAQHLKAALTLGERSLPISTLRGHYVDNRQWLEDPASPAIIVGTVDMIGSRLLFGGYGVSSKMRPYHAGLLGSDALVVLDEAHLVPPFERLLETIETDSAQFGMCGRDDGQRVPGLRLLSLSATGRDRPGEMFRLKGSLNAPVGERDDLDDNVVVRRLEARKDITLAQIETGKLAEALSAHAWRLSDNGKIPIRSIVFCNQREIAEKTKTELEALLSRDTNYTPAELKNQTELFVGARRVRERLDAARRLEDMGFIPGAPRNRTHPVFLFATSAGEVGVDLDADHMVCDLVAWERMVQRLGRVNRRGEGHAKVIVLTEPEPSPNKAAKAALEKREHERGEKDRKAIAAHQAEVEQWVAFKRPFEHALELSEDGSLNGSPAAIRALKERAVTSPEAAAAIKAATTRPPLRPALTRAVVDAWSMTSLEEHTGRPEIAPWLRGWVDQDPQTTVVWRRYLPIREDGLQSTGKDIEEFFEAAPFHLSEQLETETFHVEQWLRDRSASLLKKAPDGTDKNESRAQEPAEHAERSSDAAVNGAPLGRNAIIGFVLSKSGDWRKTLHVADFLNLTDKSRATDLDRKLEALDGAVIVVDARFGGIKDGLLSSEYAQLAESADDCETWLPVETPVAGSKSRPEPVIKFRVRPASSVQPVDTGRDWQERHRFITSRNEDGADLHWLAVDKWGADSTTEADRSESNNPQSLVDHHSATAAKARALAHKLGLKDEFTEMLAVAARLHDEGKRALRWQRAFNAPPGREPYAKTKGPINFALLDGYRHEFGSLYWAQKDAGLQTLPADLKDLALHLIAAHHGQARPAIRTMSCEDAPPSILEARAREVAMRFARLQETWGPWGLAWWEALLRAADQQASRENDEQDAGQN